MGRSKRYQNRAKLAVKEKKISLKEAIGVIKQIDQTKFDETVSLNFQLGIQSASGDENVRGTVNLPHGSGKSVKVICFCKGESAREAEKEGADFVGGEELVEKVKNGWSDFDVVVAHPDMMRDVSKLGRILGPKGLMPTPKTGTVTAQVGRSIKELKAGRIEFKSDKTGGLHAVCGKISFAEENLLENAKSVIKAVREAKPAVSKGEYLKKINIAPTQGPGFLLNIGEL